MTTQTKAEFRTGLHHVAGKWIVFQEAWRESIMAEKFTSKMEVWMEKHMGDLCWLVVWTPLKNISQLGWLFPIYGKIKNVPNHQPVGDLCLSTGFQQLWPAPESKELLWVFVTRSTSLPCRQRQQPLVWQTWPLVGSTRLNSRKKNAENHGF